MADKEPWEIHPDSETPVNDLGGGNEPVPEKPF